MKYFFAGAKAIAVCVPLAFIAGCASTSTMNVRVASEPTGAQVDVNGISIGKTPTMVSMTCPKVWVGIMNSPDGSSRGSATYEIAVYPSAANPGYSQTKRINPCQWIGD